MYKAVVGLAVGVARSAFRRRPSYRTFAEISSDSASQLSVRKNGDPLSASRFCVTFKPLGVCPSRSDEFRQVRAIVFAVMEATGFESQVTTTGSLFRCCGMRIFGICRRASECYFFVCGPFCRRSGLPDERTIVQASSDGPNEGMNTLSNMLRFDVHCVLREPLLVATVPP